MEPAVGRSSACCVGPPKRTLVCECRGSHQTRRRRPDERGEFDTLRPSKPQEGDIAAPKAQGCLLGSQHCPLPPSTRTARSIDARQQPPSGLG